MKMYYNEKSHQWYKEGELMKRKMENGSVFYGIPTKAQLKEWGYVDWSQEGRLQSAKEKKIAKLVEYDQSSAVNEFYLGGHPMWLTREERTQIDESIAAYEGTGETVMKKYFNGVPYTFPLTEWKQMLNALIVYASEALNATEAHKAAISALESIEAVEEYDFTTGYPAKPHLGE